MMGWIVANGLKRPSKYPAERPITLHMAAIAVSWPKKIYVVLLKDYRTILITCNRPRQDLS